MAAPLLYEEGALGVLEVLDRPEQTLFSLQEMELLGLFANQAAIAVDLLLKARQAEAVLGDGGGDLAVVARLAAAVDALEDERREAGLRLLRDLAETLGRGVAGATGQRKERPGRLYIPPGLSEVSYATTRPTSGPSRLWAVPVGSHRRALRRRVPRQSGSSSSDAASGPNHSGAAPPACPCGRAVTLDLCLLRAGLFVGHLCSSLSGATARGLAHKTAQRPGQSSLPPSTSATAREMLRAVRGARQTDGGLDPP